MSEWGVRTYGEPCRECGFGWHLEVEAARHLVRTCPVRVQALLSDGRETARHPALAWTAGGYACHITDNLRVWAERLAAAATGATERIVPYDPDLLAEARRYNDLPIEGILWSLHLAVDEWLDGTRLARTAGVVLQHPERGSLRWEDVVLSNSHDVHHHEWDMHRSITDEQPR